MRLALVLVILLLILTASLRVTQAQIERRWELMIGVSSAEIARNSRVSGVAALTGADGRPAIITYFIVNSDGSTVRCFDYFNMDFSQTGSACYSSR